MIFDPYLARLFASGIVGSLVVLFYWATGDPRVLTGGFAGLLIALYMTYDPED